MNNTEKVIFILEQLSRPPYESNLTELAKKMGITKSGALKILNILQAKKFILRDNVTKTYTLGHALYRLGDVYKDLKGINQISGPILKEITSITNETSYLSLWEDGEAFLMLKEEGPLSSFYEHNSSTPIPVHAGVTARVLLAFQTEETISRVIEDLEFERFTPNTISSQEALKTRIIDIRQRKYDIADSEFAPDTVAIGVPVFDRDNSVWCAIGLAGPKTRIKEDKLADYTEILRRGSKEISRLLAFRR